MKRAITIAVLHTTFASAVLVLCALRHGTARAGDDPAPTPEQLRALVARVVANQHRNEAALEQYERIERRQTRKKEQDTALSEDRTFRVVPTGTGVVRVATEENGRPVDAELYRRSLRDLEQALVIALDPDDPRQKKAVEKARKRARERAELTDAVLQAFTFTWLGRESRSGRAAAKLLLEPNPDYHPVSRNAALFKRVRATAWVEESSAQLMRIEAEMIRDFSIGGGLVGKVYRGGRFVMDQAEVAPGVWLPPRYQYDFDGRKFLFPFSVHEQTEAGRYHRIGSPSQALAEIRRELNSVPSASVH